MGTKKKGQGLKILIIEKNNDDLELILNHLKKASFKWSYTHCYDLSALVDLNENNQIDLIICNCDFPAPSSKNVLQIVQALFDDLPLIAISDSFNEQEKNKLFKDFGVTDCISKDNLQLLVHSVFREMKNLKIRRQLEVKKEEQERSLKLLKAINDITTSLLDAHSLADIAKIITRNLIVHFEFEDCVIYEFNDELNMLHQIAASGVKEIIEGDDHNALSLKLGEGIVGSVAKSKKPEIIPDTLLDDRYVVDLVKNRSEIAVPILLDGKLIGIIDSEHKEENFYTNLHLQNLQTVAGVIATKFKAAQDNKRSKKTKDQLVQITDNIEAVVFRYRITKDGKAEIKYVSSKVYDVFEIPADQALKDDTLIWDQILKEDKPAVEKSFYDSVLNESDFYIDFRIKTPSGKIKWIEATGNSIKQEDGSFITDTINKDITHRVETEKRIKANEELLRSLTNNIPGVIIRYSTSDDAYGVIDYISEGCEDIFEISQKQILTDNRKLWDIIFPEDVDAMLPTIEESAENLTLWDFIYRIKTKSGKIKYLHGIGTPKKNKDSDVITWDTVVLDKTDEILFKKEVQDTNKRLLRAQEVANIGDWSIDLTTGETEVSPMIKKIHGLDPSVDFDMSTGLSLFKEGQDRDRKKFVIDRAIEQGIPYDEELRIVTPDGEIKWVKTKGQAEHVNGECVRLFGTFMDITEQRKLRASLEQSLHDKTVLLSEIHHRVKNNLAIVTGLIDLQSQSLSDEHTKGLLSQTARRIKSIANVHEMLYNTDSFTDISFKEYLVSLTDSIQESMAYIKGEINLDIEKNLEININQAIPLGLILNELITNSFKYGFNKNSQNNSISFHFCFEEGNYKAKYSDSGNGFDSSDLENSKSLGFVLISTLLKQLDAETEMDTNNKFSLNFSFPPSLVGSHSNL